MPYVLGSLHILVALFFAVHALRSGRHVRGCFGLRILRQIGAIMASRALPRQTRVVHHRRRPGDEALGVARVALRCGWYVCCRLC